MTFPLTDFLAKLLKYAPDDLRRADPARAAQVYGINPEHAAGYIRMQRELRGCA